MSSFQERLKICGIIPYLNIFTDLLFPLMTGWNSSQVYAVKHIQMRSDLKHATRVLDMNDGY